MLTRTNGSHPLQRLRAEMDHLFEDFFNDRFALTDWSWFSVRGEPALNIWEDDQNLYAEAEVPGLRMEDLEVLTTADELTIKGERKRPDDSHVTYHRQERDYGTFTRTVGLPVSIEPDRVEACMNQGVLKITMPKTESARSRRIQVKTLTA